MPEQVIIRKHRVQINTRGLDEAFYLQKYYEENLHEEVVAMMERVFKSVPFSDQYLEINKLEIQLGRIDVQEFEHYFVKLVEEKLLLELQDKVMLDKLNSDKITTEQITGEIIELSTPLKFDSPEVEKLWYFLQHGYYPWWVKKQEQLEPSVLLKQLSEAEFNKLLIKILTGNEEKSAFEMNAVISRLFNYLSKEQQDSYLIGLALLLNDHKIISNINYLIEFREELLYQFGVSIPQYNFQLFNLLMKRGESTDLFMYQFMQQLQSSAEVSIKDLKKSLNKLKSDELKASLNRLFSKLGSEPQDITQKEAIRQGSPKSKDILTEDGIYINNAGLVLLQPFLPALFSKCGLLNDSGHIKSPESQHKGAVLLYYLQCGSDQYREWEMPLNKMLCGMAPEDLLPGDIILTESEKEECRELLKAIIKHWTVLKSSSIEAIQNTFLLREGKISKQDNKYYIIVERTGFDVLLDGLPWGFHTIKLGWLDHIIYVEW
jgi:hypothetical protein